MKDVTTGLNLHANSIKNFAISPKVDVPAVDRPVGHVYYDSAIDKLLMYNGFNYFKINRLNIKETGNAATAAFYGEGYYILNGNNTTEFTIGSYMENAVTASADVGDCIILTVTNVPANGFTITGTANEQIGGGLTHKITRDTVLTLIKTAADNWTPSDQQSGSEIAATVNDFTTTSPDVLYVAADDNGIYRYDATNGYVLLQRGLPYKGSTNIDSGAGVYSLDSSAHDEYVLPAATGSGDRRVISISNVVPSVGAFLHAVGIRDTPLAATVNNVSGSAVVIEDDMVFPDELLHSVQILAGPASGDDAALWSARYTLTDKTTSSTVHTWDATAGSSPTSMLPTAVMLDSTHQYSFSVESLAQTTDVKQLTTGGAFGNGNAVDHALEFVLTTDEEIGGTLLTSPSTINGVAEHSIQSNGTILLVDSVAGNWSLSGDELIKPVYSTSVDDGEGTYAVTSSVSDAFRLPPATGSGNTRVIAVENDGANFTLNSDFGTLMQMGGDTAKNREYYTNLSGTFYVTDISKGLYNVTFDRGEELGERVEALEDTRTETYPLYSDFPTVGIRGRLYVAEDENAVYRYSTATNSYVDTGGVAAAGGLPYMGATNTGTSQGVYSVDGAAAPFTLPAATGSGDRYILAVKDIPPLVEPVWDYLGDASEMNTDTLPMQASTVTTLEDNIVFPQLAHFTGADYVITGTSGMPPWSADFILVDVTNAGSPVTVATWDMGTSGFTVPHTGGSAVIVDPAKTYRIDIDTGNNSFQWVRHGEDLIGNGGANEAQIELNYRTLPSGGSYNITPDGSDTMTNGDAMLQVTSDTVVILVDSGAGKWSAGNGAKGDAGADGDQGTSGDQGNQGDPGEEGPRGFSGAGDIIRVANFAGLPSTGSDEDIYCTTDTGKIYRWDGSPTSAYFELSPPQDISAKADLVSGKVPSGQLPSFVDDVLEFTSFGTLPGTGTAGIIYVTTDDNKTYRWSGSAYAEISASLALGLVTGTAYDGGLGAALATTVADKEDTANKTTTVRADGTADDTKFPTEKAVRDAVKASEEGIDAQCHMHVDTTAFPAAPNGLENHLYLALDTGRLYSCDASGVYTAIGSDDKYYTETFTSAVTWTVNHNLDKLPAVTVMNSSGEVMLSPITHVSDSQCTINHSVAVAGSVSCS